jgi:hypothetical protein
LDTPHHHAINVDLWVLQSYLVAAEQGEEWQMVLAGSVAPKQKKKTQILEL